MLDLDDTFSQHIIMRCRKNLECTQCLVWMGRNFILFQLVRSIRDLFQFNDLGILYCERLCPQPVLWDVVLGQTHVNGWSRVVASQNKGSTDYIFPLRLGVLQWSRHLFNYWKNKKTIIEKFLILLIWNWIYIDHRKLHGFGPRYNLR